MRRSWPITGRAQRIPLLQHVQFVSPLSTSEKLPTLVVTRQVLSILCLIRFYNIDLLLKAVANIPRYY